MKKVPINNIKKNEEFEITVNTYYPGAPIYRRIGDYEDYDGEEGGEYVPEDLYLTEEEFFTELSNQTTMAEYITEGGVTAIECVLAVRNVNGLLDRMKEDCDEDGMVIDPDMKNKYDDILKAHRERLGLMTGIHNMYVISKEELPGDAEWLDSVIETNPNFINDVLNSDEDLFVIYLEVYTSSVFNRLDDILDEPQVKQVLSRMRCKSVRTGRKIFSPDNLAYAEDGWKNHKYTYWERHAMSHLDEVAQDAAKIINGSMDDVFTLLGLAYPEFNNAPDSMFPYSASMKQPHYIAWNDWDTTGPDAWAQECVNMLNISVTANY